MNTKIVKTINFDMDGTICDLYTVNDWLPKLRAYDPSPYREASPMVNMSSLARILNKLRKNGYEINIISWCSKCSTPDYDAKIEIAKKKWLKEHLPSVQFDNVHIVPYGTPKTNFSNGFLFDDETANRLNWIEGKNNLAFNEKNILKVLKDISDEKIKIALDN